MPAQFPAAVNSKRHVTENVTTVKSSSAISLDRSTVSQATQTVAVVTLHLLTLFLSTSLHHPPGPLQLGPLLATESPVQTKTVPDLLAGTAARPLLPAPPRSLALGPDPPPLGA